MLRVICPGTAGEWPHLEALCCRGLALGAAMSKRWMVSLLMLAPLPAMAGLGDGVSSVQEDAGRFHVAHHATQRAGYTEYSLDGDASVQVVEFTNPAGQVFAVTWRGHTKPDLQQLFGRYASDYRASFTRRGAHPSGQAYLAGDMVVMSGGRLGAFQGYAYLPALVPAGFSLSQLTQ